MYWQKCVFPKLAAAFQQRTWQIENNDEGQFCRLPRVMEIAAHFQKSRITPFVFAEKTAAEVQLIKNQPPT
jgi:hypothetical protein